MDELSNNSEQFHELLSNLEKRISRIESYLRISDKDTRREYQSDKYRKKTEEEKQSLEFEIGQYWFAKLGIVGIAIGIAIILTLPFNNFSPYLPPLFGYVISVLLFISSRYLKHDHELISKYLFGSGFLLLFFSTLRIHYWGHQPLLINPIYEYILLILISLALLFVSIRKKSIYLFNIGLTLGAISSLASEGAYVIFLTISALAFITSYVKIKFEWGKLFYYSIVLTYITHLVWFINNPIVHGNNISLLKGPYLNVFFLMVYLVIIALGNIFRSFPSDDNKQNVASSFVNSFGFLIIFSFINITQFTSELTISFISASILFLILSILFWKKEQDKYSVFFFAIIGYITLSIAIINAFTIPNLFILLVWQSILVISTAIWFRSKIIIIANFLIYLGIILGTIILSRDSALSFISISLVSLLSARILNYQKSHLDIKTEAMRNTYLSIAFLFLPYSAFLLVPIEYLGFIWLAIALFYYLMSLVLRNIKYRWMAITTLALTILYTFILGILHPDNTLKVLSFLSVGVVLMLISVIYSRIRAKEKSKE